MRTKLIIPETMLFYKYPSMILVTYAPRGLNFSIEESPEKYLDFVLLKNFSDNKNTKAICIDGIEEGPVMNEVQSFMLTARKYFNPEDRPLIIIFSAYSIDELKKKSFSGLESELLQYGNSILLTKKDIKINQKKLFRKYGLDGFSNNLLITEYTGHRYE